MKYGAVNKGEEKALEAMETLCWRRIERISQVDRKTYKEVLDDVENERNLIKMIKTRWWKMIGHTIILSEELHLQLTLESVWREGREEKSDIASSSS